jgi:hypothetical protein
MTALKVIDSKFDPKRAAKYADAFVALELDICDLVRAAELLRSQRTNETAGCYPLPSGNSRRWPRTSRKNITNCTTSDPSKAPGRPALVPP